ncbi:type II toxin-antitoxin system ParD family antitoxin [Chamaesiphon sp. VAR_69_metabat_338]|uniref:ribbon-helix-helix domain-containing protein n=1 Tax=Chamaesiphon sp. VAR_69_metabat_338 TaxID=2964704 RepID=UPI00286DCD40|nr:type II toxin-antitoxin system ParD family antitoxin [Chamaesiphon sp. VAR_69_metabat_338]
MLTITPEHEKLIQNHLDTGRYANAEEVLAIALQLLARLDTEHQTWIEETRQQIAIGIAELDSAEPTLRERGEGVDGATAMEGYLQQFQAARQTRLS